jgi:hypothetical protein
MHQATLVFLLALVLAGLSAGISARVRSGLLRPGFWLALAVAAGASSAVSLLASASRRAGTGITTSYGWPKPFYFRYVSEVGERSDGYSLIYFVGNSFALAGGLLIAWIAWRLIRRQA